jgi:AcrR family transcriptional regulator
MSGRRQYSRTPQRRADIVAAALETFSEQGYQEASIREIARRVQLSEAGVLHHFGSKTELLLAVLRKRDAVDIANYDTGEGELETMRAFIKHNLTVPGIIRLYARLSAESLEASHPAHKYFKARAEAVIARFRQRLANDQRRGLIRADVNIPEAATQLLALIDGLQLQWLMDSSLNFLAIYDDFVSRWLPAERTAPKQDNEPAPPDSSVASLELRFLARNLDPNSTNKAHDPATAAAAGFEGGMVVGADMYWHVDGAISRMREAALLNHAIEVKFVKPLYDGQDAIVRVEATPDSNLGFEVFAAAARDKACIVGSARPLARGEHESWARDFRHAPLPEAPVSFSEDFALAGKDLGSVSFAPSLEEANRHRVALGMRPSDEEDLPSAYLVQYSRLALRAKNVIGPTFSVHTSTVFRQFAKVTPATAELQVRGRYDRVFARRGHRFVVLRTVVLDGSERVLIEAEYTSIYRLRNAG